MVIIDGIAMDQDGISMGGSMGMGMGMLYSQLGRYGYGYGYGIHRYLQLFYIGIYYNRYLGIQVGVPRYLRSELIGMGNYYRKSSSIK